MCNIGKFLDRAIIHPVTSFFAGPATSGLDAQLKQQTDALTAQTGVLQQSLDQQRADSAAALAAQQDAAKQAAVAATPAKDSESFRVAAEVRMRRLLAATTGVKQGTRLLGEPPVGYRMLTGA